MQPDNRNRRDGGVTLVELLVTLAILAVLAAFTVPSFRELRASVAAGSAANELLLSLHRARSVALTEAAATQLCPTDLAGRCTDGGVARGYRVFREAAPEAALESVRLPATLRLVTTRERITYWPWPRAGTTVTFTLCDPAVPAAARQVIVSQTGRPRVQRAPGAACG